MMSRMRSVPHSACQHIFRISPDITPEPNIKHFKQTYSDMQYKVKFNFNLGIV